MARMGQCQNPQNNQRLFELAGLHQCLSARNNGGGGPQ